MARKDYTLVVFDKDGVERPNDAGQLASTQLVQTLKAGGITDVFVMSHGWMGDIPSAVTQYNNWTDALLACTGDITKITAKRPGFKPLLIGIHWPSLPWGDEKAISSFALTLQPDNTYDPVADYSQRLGGTPEIHDAVSRIFSATAAAPNYNVMPDQLRAAYIDLDKALGMGADGAGSAPGSDREPFDPQEVFDASNQSQNTPGHISSFGDFGLGGLLAPLRVLSFWKMKDRARQIGASGASSLLNSLQAAAGTAGNVHLMGHSFGCIVVSSLAKTALKPVQSMVLVQGALSLWSYAPKIVPDFLKRAGFYTSIVSDAKVAGPIVTTQSRFDRAVGIFYPIAAGVALQVSFALSFPLFGGLGSFGAQGADNTIGLTAMLSTDQQYGFQPRQIYNIESSNIIRAMSGLNGAHSDINHPEVGHVIWQAALAS